MRRYVQPSGGHPSEGFRAKKQVKAVSWLLHGTLQLKTLVQIPLMSRFSYIEKNAIKDWQRLTSHNTKTMQWREMLPVDEIIIIISQTSMFTDFMPTLCSIGTTG